MEGFRTHAQGLGKGFGAGRQDHELLDVDVVVRMGAAVEDVHHRHGQNLGVDAAQVVVERHLHFHGRGLGNGHGHAEDGVGAQFFLVGGVVKCQHGAVDEHLPGGFETEQGWGDDLVDVAHRLENTLAAVAVAVPVTEFQGLARAGGSARGYRCPADGAGFQLHLRLDRWIAPRIKYFPGDDSDNFAHISSPLVDGSVQAGVRRHLRF